MIALLAASTGGLASPSTRFVASVGLILIGCILVFDVRGIATWFRDHSLWPGATGILSPMRFAGALLLVGGIFVLVRAFVVF